MADRLGDFAHNWPMPIFLWLRLITGQRLMQITAAILGRRSTRRPGIRAGHGSRPWSRSRSSGC